MHHEALPVHGERQPLGAVDDDGRGRQREGLDDPFRGRVPRRLADGVVVEGVRAVVEGQDGADAGEPGGGEAVAVFGDDEGVAEGAEGGFDRAGLCEGRVLGVW